MAAASPQDRSFAALRMTRIVDDAAGPMLRCAQEDKTLLGVILSNAKDPADDMHPAAWCMRRTARVLIPPGAAPPDSAQDRET